MDGGSSYTTLWIYFIPLTTHLKTIKMVRVVMCSLPSLKNKTQTPHLPWDYKAVCNRGSPVSLISYPLCSSLYTWYLPSFYVLSPWRAVSGIFLSKPSDHPGQSFSVASSEKPLLTHLRMTTSPVSPSLSSFVSTYVISLPQNVVSISVSYQEACDVHLPHSWWC